MNELNITEEDISEIENFNMGLLKEATREVGLKKKDEENRKDRIDKKAYILLITTLSFILLFSILILDEKISLYIRTIGLFLLIPLNYSYKACKAQGYYGSGHCPSLFLNERFLTKNKTTKEDDKVTGYILATLLFRAYKVIQNNFSANNNRIILLGKALYSLVLITTSIITTLTFGMYYL